jgi:arabinoxylan arabinofuranohydrolase
VQAMTPSFIRRSSLIALGLLAQAWFFSPRIARADNPIVQNIYTADPAPMVDGDTVYLCTSHDEDVTKDNFFTMDDWRVFSTKDMVNWTDHGSPLSYRTFSWATGKAWAPHCIARGGKYYMFVPVSDAIGVAVADSPTGPFKDAIGKPLLSNYQYIDPTVFIDTDGQAYLYFGNPKLWYVKLNSDMTSYTGQVQQVSMTSESFGQRSGVADRPTLYEEGPWFYKRNDLYYMMFAMGPLPEKIGYSTSASATGPWSYKGVIMNSQSGHAFTNHSGVVDFKGHSYFFYHTQELSGGGGYKRSVAVEEFTYKADGTFPTITKTAGGVTQSAAPLNPYGRVEGETIAWAPNVEIENCSEGGRNVTSIENNDSIKVESVNFLTGAVSFSARVASAGAGGSIELHLDSATGTLLGTCAVPATGGAQKWQAVTCPVSGATGIKDLVLVFKGGSGSLFNLDSWQFTPKDPLPNGTGGSGGGGSGGMAAGGASASAGAVNGGAATGGGASSAAGAAGSATGGNSTGGVSPNGGTVSTTGGSGGTSPPAGGRPATGGTSSAGVTPPSAQDDSGCGCSTVGRGSLTPAWPVALLGALVTAAQLRRSRRKQSKAR